MLKIENIKSEETNYWNNIYSEAFPPQERVDFQELNDLTKRSDTHMAVIKDSDTNVGIIFYSQLSPKSAYIFFFAIDSNLRGQNLGSQVLNLLKEKFPDGLILESEKLGLANSNNEEQRKRRYNFYLKNGFTDSQEIMTVTTSEKLSFHILTTGDDYVVKDYKKLLVEIQEELGYSGPNFLKKSKA